MNRYAEAALETGINKIADLRSENEGLRASLIEARDWIANEIKHAEVELPDAEAIVARANQALPNDNKGN